MTRDQRTILKGDNIVALQTEDVSRIARGAGTIFVGTVVGGGLGYLFQIIVARYLGIELFGLFSLGFAVFSVAAVIAPLGMDNGVVRYVSLYHGVGDQRRVKGTIRLAYVFTLSGGIAVSLLLIALSKMLAVDVFHSAELTSILRLFAVAIPFFALTTVFLASIQALRIMKYQVYVRDLFELLLRLGITLLVFQLGWRLWGILAACVVSTIAGTFLSLYFYRKTFQPIVKDGIQPIFEPGKLLAFCWPLLFANCFYLVENRLATFMLGYFSTVGAVGVFSAAYGISLLAKEIFISFSIMFSPVISDLHHRGENGKLENLFKVVAKWIFSLSMPIILLMIILPHEILTTFGRDFAVGATCLIILGVGQILYSLTGPLESLIIMSGMSKVTLFNAVIQFLLQAGLCIFLIPLYGITGAALAVTISISILRLIRLLQVYINLKIHPFRFVLLKPIVAAGTSGLVLYLVRVYFINISNSVLLLIGGSIIFLIIYGVILYLLGFDEEDRVVFGRIKSRFAV